ncbi:MAG TPA: histidine phosphatase family protein [Myxococcales bacterium]|nr:histidine phosphatase family protein [Myxococcales bacterium]
MRLVLVRHGDAEPELSAPIGLGDHGRALTSLGRDQARDTARWLCELSPGGSHQVWTSPLVRAVQTAELLAEGWRGAPVAVAGALGTGQSVAAQLDLVAGLPASNDVSALVGHEPSLSQLAAELLGLPGLPIAFEKGAALVLTTRGKGWTFEAYRAPMREPLLALP